MRIALSRSGGKDCALALWRLRLAGQEPMALLTTVDEETGAVAHHGIPGELVRAQAAAAGLPLVVIPVPRGAGNARYEERLRSAFATPPLDAVDAVAFGDIFLEDLRAYREQRLAEAGLAAVFPLWGEPSPALAAEVAAHFAATVVSLDLAVLGEHALGRRYDAAFVAALPEGADPCGERGEFHTFVHDGPVFAAPVAHALGRVRRDAAHAWQQLRASGR